MNDENPRIFPRSLYFGVDLLFLPRFQRHALLEVNAFGDLLPGVTIRSFDTFQSELVAWRDLDRCFSVMASSNLK